MWAYKLKRDSSIKYVLNDVCCCIMQIDCSPSPCTYMSRIMSMTYKQRVLYAFNNCYSGILLVILRATFFGTSSFFVRLDNYCRTYWRKQSLVKRYKADGKQPLRVFDDRHSGLLVTTYHRLWTTDNLYYISSLVFVIIECEAGKVWSSASTLGLT